MASFIQSGLTYYGVNYFGVTTPNWTLLGATGTRLFTGTIVFSTTFNLIPVVHAAFASLDILPGSGVQLDLQVTNVTISGFTFQLLAWDNCKVIGAGISWLAATA